MLRITPELTQGEKKTCTSDLTIISWGLLHSSKRFIHRRTLNRISSKPVHNFLSNPANKQNKQSDK